MTAREYWVWTEIFVYLHGSDECRLGARECGHCAFLAVLWDSMQNEE